MHTKLRVMDVTLRDGGNRNDFHFTDRDLEALLPPLDKAAIDYIEVGYRNGAIRPVEGIGRAGLCHKQYLLHCRALIKQAKLVVMAHAANINEMDLLDLKNCGVDLLRICIAKGGALAAKSTIACCKRLELPISVNVIHISQYTEPMLDQVVDELASYEPDMIYFADSNGSLLPARVTAMYKKYVHHYPIPFGFHAHDNLGLAQANTIAAMKAGVQYIDFTLSGMGKGIGNLRTEYFLAYLQALNHKKYDLETLLSAVNYIRTTFDTGTQPIDMDEFVRGITDLSTAEISAKRNQTPK